MGTRTADLDLAPLHRRGAAAAVDLAVFIVGAASVGAVVSFGSIMALQLFGITDGRNAVAAETAGWVALAATAMMLIGASAATGQTPGRRLLRIRLERADGGGPPGVLALSHALWFGLGVVAFGVTFTGALRRPRRVLLHDRWSSTRTTVAPKK